MHDPARLRATRVPLLAAAVTFLSASAALAQESPPPQAHFGLSAGLGVTHAFAGVRLEVGIGRVSIFGAVGLPEPSLPEWAGPFRFDSRSIWPTWRNQFNQNSPTVAGGARYLSKATEGLLLSAQVAYASAGPGGFPFPRDFLLVAPSLTAGWRWAYGPVFAEAAAGPAAMIVKFTEEPSFGGRQTNTTVTLDLQVGLGLRL